MGEIFIALVFAVVFTIALWKLGRWIEGLDMGASTPQAHGDDSGEEYEEEQDEYDDDEVNYWVSQGWSAGNGPPPPLH